MAKLSVNIDHVATLRQARRTGVPDLVAAARLCEAAGAQGITVHLRKDQRHIQEADLFRLRRSIRTRLDVELSCEPAMIRKVIRVRPELVTLVPEFPGELTTQGGLDIVRRSRHVRNAMTALQARGIRVALFIDPDLGQIRMARRLGAEAVEINTGRYADAVSAAGRRRGLQNIRRAIGEAVRCGLQVNAGHGLHEGNIRPLTSIRHIEEYNIGFHIIARALFVGLERAVRDMVRLVR